MSSYHELYEILQAHGMISIGKESIEGEPDDIFLKIIKKQQKEKIEIMIN
jgi:hypothetical protein